VDEIKIDITAPAITVSYSNNIARSQRYFGADRVASIFVTERNFRPEDVVITLTNTDGVIPEVSAWTELAGDGNGDNTQWRASITYSADGDYTFGIAFTDPAGNANAAVNYGNSVAPTEFTMDQTDPVVAVSYDNNSVQNGNYYKEKREATIVITEHNLVPEGEDADRITITMTATDDGNEAEIPSVSEWVTNGDTHTAKIVFDKDAFYTFDISVRDKVDNAAEEFATQEFYVDKTAPTLIISEVENDSANTGSVRPVVTYSDTNFDAQQINLAIRGENRGVLKADGVYADITNGRVFTFNDFADEKSNDDIYTIEASLTDKAGNVTTQSVRFSINRYGSTYMMEESSKEILGTYTMDAKDFVVKEINADELKNVKITLFKNNETIILNEGADYRIDVLGSSGQWKEYTYVIFAKNFEDDGVYRVSVYSEDAAGNIAENTQDTKESNISFGVDKTAPTVVIGNLEAGKTYAMDSLSVQLYANDNLLLDRVDVYLDDYENVYQTWSAAELEEIFASLGEIQFDIAGESTSAHNLMVVCADAAGNELVEEITDFYVTTNIAVQFYNNKILFYGSIVGVVLAVAVVVFGVVYKGRKKAAK